MADDEQFLREKLKEVMAEKEALESRIESMIRRLAFANVLVDELLDPAPSHDDQGNLIEVNVKKTASQLKELLADIAQTPTTERT